VVTPSAETSRDGAPSDLVGRLHDALTVNRCAVTGPVAAADAPALVADLAVERAAGAAIALPTRDPAVVWLELESRLGASGAHLLHPDDPGWRQNLADAGVGVTGCLLAVAATGTLALVAGPGMPRATSLVPPAHVCIVRTGDVVAELGDAIDRIATAPLPSAVSWIGGPSRTADLEMRTTFGVHGPKTVDVVLVDA
jgi:L-lactate dehydrogenase complex protein LldG